MSLFGCGMNAALRFYQPFDFFQHRLQIRSICGDDIVFPNVFVMRRRGQFWKVRRVVVAKDHCPIGALIMKGVGFLEGMFLPNEEFSEMQKRVVNEINIDAQKPDFAAILMMCFDFINERRAEKHLVNPFEIFTIQHALP